MVKRLILLMVFLLVVLAACGGEDEANRLPTFTPAASSTPTTPPPTRVPPAPAVTIVPNPSAGQSATATPLPPAAQVRLVQGNTALDAVDIYIGNQVVAARFRPGNYSNRPVEVPSGEITLRIVPAGSINSPSNSLFEQTLTLQPREDAVLYLYGDATSIRLQAYSQDLSPLAAETARVAFINAVTLSPALAVIANGAGIAQNLNYSEFQSGIILPSGAYELAFQAGSGVVQKVEQTLASQQVYTFMLIGDASQGQYQTIVFSEAAAPQSFVRLVHASPDTPAVRLFIGGALIAENLNYRDVSEEFISLDAGRFEVRVESADATLVESTLNFTANTHFDLLIYDRFVDLRVGLFPLDSTPLGSNTARLTIINAMPTETLVRATVPNRIVDTNTLAQKGLLAKAEDIPFGTASRPMLVQAGAQTFDFLTISLGEPLPLFTSPEYTLEQGSAYTFIMLGRQGTDSVLLDYPVGLQTESETAVGGFGETLTEARFVNGIRTLETVDVLIDGELAADDLGFGQGSDRLSVLPNVELQLTVTSADGRTPLLEQSFFARQNTRMTIYLFGTADEIQVFSATDPEEGLLRGQARARFVDAMYSVDAIALTYIAGSPSAGEVLQSPSDQPPAENQDIGTTFRFGDSASVDLLPGFYELTVYDVEDGTPLRRVPFEVQADTLYDFLVLETTEDFVLVPLARAND